MKANKKQFTIKISTYEADVEFDVKPKCTGQDLFNLACVTFGIRETWYFGLQFADSVGAGWWLKADKRMAEVARGLPAGSQLHFLFHVKFWVEDVAEDLLLEATVHMFYLEVKDMVLVREEWSASPELLLLLAAHAAQVELGDYDESKRDDGDQLLRLLPPRLESQQASELAACEEKIRDHYRDLAGLSRVEAELQLLKLAQDLEMFGLVYFPIQTGGPTAAPASWLGVSCYGVNFYEQETKAKPYRRLGWNEIRNMSYRDRKFTLATTTDAQAAEPNCFGEQRGAGRSVTFWTSSSADCKQILHLCVGNHELFMARRMPDSIERQQMRATAREERERRQADKQRLLREIDSRAAAERLRGVAEEKVGHLSQLLAKSEAMVDLLSERARLAEDEMRVMTEQQDRQIGHMRHIHNQLLAEKLALADRARQFESLLMTLSEEASVNEAERECLRQQLNYAKRGERSLLQKLESLLKSVGVWSSGDSSVDLGFLDSAGEAEPPDTEQTMEELLAQLEAEKRQFAESSAAFETDLRQLRNKVHSLRVSERLSAENFHLPAAAASLLQASDPELPSAHSPAVSCRLLAPGSGNLGGRSSRGAVTYFDEL